MLHRAFVPYPQHQIEILLLIMLTCGHIICDPIYL
jgi:hypothetical protein